MPTYEGPVEFTAQNRVRIHDGDSRTFVELRERDREQACFLGEVSGIAQWSVRVAEQADSTTGTLSPEEWEALFVTAVPRSFREAPSVHNSWCPTCPSVGVSHGVCCP